MFTDQEILALVAINARLMLMLKQLEAENARLHTELENVPGAPTPGPEPTP
jgi:hypothetical protein